MAIIGSYRNAAGTRKDLPNSLQQPSKLNVVRYVGCS